MNYFSKQRQINIDKYGLPIKPENIDIKLKVPDFINLEKISSSKDQKCLRKIFQCTCCDVKLGLLTSYEFLLIS